VLALGEEGGSSSQALPRVLHIRGKDTVQVQLRQYYSGSTMVEINFSKTWCTAQVY
jgi:hypothetical protein